MKVLFVDRKDDSYFLGFSKNLDYESYEIFLLDLKNREYTCLNTGEITKLINHNFLIQVKGINYLLRYFAAISFMLKFWNSKWDICHYLAIKRENIWLLPFIRKRVPKLIITIYGRSTFLNKMKRLFFRPFYKYADTITFQNKATKKEFLSFNRRCEKFHFEEMPLPIDHFRKAHFSASITNKANAASKLNLRNDLVRISCSSTIGLYDQHFKVIDALKKWGQSSKVQLLFLLTYGGSTAERDKIVERIETELSGFIYEIFTESLSNEDILNYRHATDIYINMRTSDQIAGSVLESLATGSFLLSAEWLNYQLLDNLDINYVKVRDFDHLVVLLDHAVETFPIFYFTHGLNNSMSILEHFAVENVIEKWMYLYKS
ncbi:MAG: hypothetical protein Q8S18_12860 [Bacteroidales bacterium]|nr:hypothetical protein [Bacteroidales bacterium]